MTLDEPRSGVQFDFSSQPRAFSQGTITSAESILWASLRHLSSRDVANALLADVHGIALQRKRVRIVANLKPHIIQAIQFYDAAKHAAPTSSPLLFYYCFLNLAKALCEISFPSFHKTLAYYSHGLSWRPSQRWLVNPRRDAVRATGTGVWHRLLESTTGSSMQLNNPTRLGIRSLFSLCPEVSVEYLRACGAYGNLIPLIRPSFMTSDSTPGVWIHLEVSRERLRDLRISRATLKSLLGSSNVAYQQVRSKDAANVGFESNVILPPGTRAKTLHDTPLFIHVRELRVFTCMDNGRIEYFVPHYPKPMPRLPQIAVLYSLMFWLGSLVRYDPHSVHALQDSRYWTLIDGFISQSTLWLLEQFVWHFYRTESALSGAR